MQCKNDFLVTLEDSSQCHPFSWLMGHYRLLEFERWLLEGKWRMTRTFFRVGSLFWNRSLALAALKLDENRSLCGKLDFHWTLTSEIIQFIEQIVYSRIACTFWWLPHSLKKQCVKNVSLIFESVKKCLSLSSTHCSRPFLFLL